MKKYIIYTAILLLGLALGWLIFGDRNPADQSAVAHQHDAKEADSDLWTCSMHPQIRLPEPGDCPICGMDLIPLDAANNNLNPLVFEMTEDAMSIANIQTSTVGQSSHGNAGQLKLSGRIKADETNSASIVAHIAGRIEKLYVSYTGEKINKGQKVASIYAPKLIAAQKELLEAYKVKEMQPELYEATVNKLKFWKLTDTQIQNIISSEKLIESFAIYADYAGVVINKKVSVGDYVNEGESLFDLQNLNKLWAVFDVYESDLSHFKIGQKISFKTPALPNKTFTSTINFLDPVINPNTRTAAIRLSINNGGQQLKPEMFIEGKMQLDDKNAGAISIPKSAVLWTGERSVVYVKQPNLSTPSFEFREIVLGQAVGKNYQVISGLSNGEEIVTNGAFVIDASAQLNNQSSMMNRNLLVNEDGEPALPDYTTSATTLFKNQLQEVLASYLQIKNALIASDDKLVESKRGKLIAAINKVDMKQLKGAAHVYWMNEGKELLNLAKKFEAGEGLEMQRTHFSEFSNLLIQLTKVFGVESDTYYVQYCPMAENKNGGYWLSLSQDINNPYFGDAMLGCGSVEDSIDKDYKNKTIVKPSTNQPMAGHHH